MIKLGAALILVGALCLLVWVWLVSPILGVGVSLVLGGVGLVGIQTGAKD